MNILFEKNKIFFAIILGALIIGFGIYFGLHNNTQNIKSLQNIRTSDIPPTLNNYSNIPRNNGIVKTLKT